MNRDEKTAMIQELSDTVAKAPHAFLIDYTGITVPAVTDLRRQIRGTKSEYLVVKNTLALRAIKGKPIEALAEHFTGMTAIAYSQTDVVALAKVIHTFGKTNPHVKVKAALLDGKAVPASSLEALATMPSRSELIARLLGLMQSPVRRLVTVLSAPHRNVAATLAAITRQKEQTA
ncbi:MAG: 50S ribosomal protein L10 [Thermoanaerobaculia bacterium]|nr:50S ribosomal protein L10 [Thermoanaerobaculia bacterium]